MHIASELTPVWLLSATAFACASSGTPGPNNTMIAASGANFGFARTMPHIFGVTVGFCVVLGLFAFGLGFPLREWPWIHTCIRWVGAAYLIWLAWKIGRSAPSLKLDRLAQGKPLSFVAAALFQWVNPKVWFMTSTAIVTYTNSGAGMAAQTLMLIAIFFFVTPFACALWALVGVGAGRVVSTPAGLRYFNLAMAALLLFSTVTMVFEK